LRSRLRNPPVEYSHRHTRPRMRVWPPSSGKVMMQVLPLNVVTTVMVEPKCTVPTQCQTGGL
jgi:hypothetical protein